MPRPMRFLLQALVYAATAALIGFFASRPVIEHFPPDRAQIKMNLVHGATRKEDCRRRTTSELEALAPNMRKALACERERLPVWLELAIDGTVLYAESLPPTGLSGDGPSRAYRRFVVAPGPHVIRLRLRDTDRAEGYDYELEQPVELAPRQNLGIDFHSESGFVLM